MMYYGQGLSLGVCAALCGVAVVIYFIMRCGVTRRTRMVLAISLFCATLVALAMFDIARNRQAQRGYSVAWPSVVSPPGMFETTDSDNEAESKDEAVSRSVTIEARAGDRHAVEVESVRKGKGGTGSVAAVGKKRTQVMKDASPNAPEAASALPHRIRFAWSIGGFSLLLVLAYLFLDAGRSQRYTWPRRMAIAAAFVAVCAIFWRIIPLM